MERQEISWSWNGRIDWYLFSLLLNLLDSNPSMLEQSTGKARIEYLALLEGKDPYHGLLDPLEVTARGTKKNPIMVKSPDEDRIVGCQGKTS